jgi:hypothetical protein
MTQGNWITYFTASNGKNSFNCISITLVLYCNTGALVLYCLEKASIVHHWLTYYKS